MRHRPPAETIPFSTERLIARPWQPEQDAAAAWAIFGDVCVRRFTGGPLADVDAVRARLADTAAVTDASGGRLGGWALARRDDGEIVGRIELRPLPGHERVEVGWEITRRWWGSGYATEAGSAAVAYGVDVAGLDEVVAVVDPANRRSRAVAQRVGLAPIGRLVAYGRSLDAFAARRSAVDPRHVHIREAAAGDVIGLRQRVLRPHQAPSDLLADDDRDAVDLAATTLDGRVVACARLCREPPPWPAEDRRWWRLRNMATAADARGLGLGSQLVHEVAARAATAGGQALWCAARTAAVDFYARCGFVAATDAYDDPDLGPHVGMIASDLCVGRYDAAGSA